MKVSIERLDHADAFCDQCLGKFIRDGVARPCFLTEEDDGEESLTLTITDGEQTTVYVIPKEQQHVIYEPSRELPEFAVVEKENE